MLRDELLDFLKARNDALFAWCASDMLFASISMPSSASNASSSSVNVLAIGGLLLHARQKGYAFSHLLFPGISRGQGR